MVWVAGAILPTTLIIATARDTALSLVLPRSTRERAPAFHRRRLLARAVPLRFSQRGRVRQRPDPHDAPWPIVAQGLHRTILVMFGGALLTGSGGEFLALLGLVALVFAVCSVRAQGADLDGATAILFVAGPLFIALTPLPVVGVSRARLVTRVDRGVPDPDRLVHHLRDRGGDQPGRDEPGRGRPHRQSRRRCVRGARHLLHRPEVAADGARPRPLLPRRPRRAPWRRHGWWRWTEQWGARGKGSALQGEATGRDARRRARHRPRRGPTRSAPRRPRRSSGQAGPGAARGRVGERGDHGGAAPRAATSDGSRGARRQRGRQAARHPGADARGMAIRRRATVPSRIGPPARPRRATHPRQTKRPRRTGQHHRKGPTWHPGQPRWRGDA